MAPEGTVINVAGNKASLTTHVPHTAGQQARVQFEISGVTWKASDKTALKVGTKSATMNYQTGVGNFGITDNFKNHSVGLSWQYGAAFPVSSADASSAFTAGANALDSVASDASGFHNGRKEWLLKHSDDFSAIGGMVTMMRRIATASPSHPLFGVSVTVTRDKSGTAVNASARWIF